MYLTGKPVRIWKVIKPLPLVFMAAPNWSRKDLCLKGGITSVARHPERNEIVIGGSDGVPKVYRMFRETARRIGDDANLIRRLPPMQGRVFSMISVAVVGCTAVSISAAGVIAEVVPVNVMYAGTAVLAAGTGAVGWLIREFRELK